MTARLSPRRPGASILLSLLTTVAACSAQPTDEADGDAVAGGAMRTATGSGGAIAAATGGTTALAGNDGSGAAGGSNSAGAGAGGRPQASSGGAGGAPSATDDAGTPADADAAIAPSCDSAQAATCGCPELNAQPFGCAFAWGTNDPGGSLSAYPISAVHVEVGGLRSRQRRHSAELRRL